MEKKIRIIIDLVVIVVASIFLIFGIKDAITMFNKSKVTDNVKFSKSYPSIEKNNIYKYVNLKETLKLLDKGSALVLIGKTIDPWMQVLVNPLEDYSKDHIKEIYYLELDDLDSSSKEYLELTKKIGKLSSPEVLIIKDGNIITKLLKNDIIDSNYDGIPIEYFDEDNIKKLNENLKEISNLK